MCRLTSFDVMYVTARLDSNSGDTRKMDTKGPSRQTIYVSVFVFVFFIDSVCLQRTLGIRWQ